MQLSNFVSTGGEEGLIGKQRTARAELSYGRHFKAYRVFRGQGAPEEVSCVYCFHKHFLPQGLFLCLEVAPIV